MQWRYDSSLYCGFEIPRESRTWRTAGLVTCFVLRFFLSCIPFSYDDRDMKRVTSNAASFQSRYVYAFTVL